MSSQPPLLDVVCMVLAADPVSPSLVRQRFRRWLGAMEWPERDGDDIVMAVSEAVCNAVEHAYPPDSDGEIRVAARKFDDAQGGRRIVVAVEDDGRWRPFPPATRHRGHGLLMMHACMDVVDLCRDQPGTTVVMTSVGVSRAYPAQETA